MRKTLSISIMMLLVVALVTPTVALAGNGRGNGGASTAQQAENGASHGKSAAKAEKQALKAEKKAAKAQAKADRKAAMVAAGGESDEASESLEPTDSVGVPDSGEPSGSVDATSAPDVSNAFTRITANIEKSLAKIADGKKKQVPPGLIRVWMKFAAWLGVDASTMPGSDSGTSADPTEEPTSTVEPTETVEPTSTVTPTETVEPTVTPVL